MKRALAILTLGVLFVLPMGAVATGTALAASPAVHTSSINASTSGVHCPGQGYTNFNYCVPPTGVVNATLCGEHFTGTAKPNTGITCNRIGQLVTLPCSGETAESIDIKGTGLNITVAGPRIYKFNPATGTSTRVSAITGSGGEYTKVFGSCGVSPSTLPTTGGGIAPAGGGLPLLPLGLGIMMLLAGAAVTARTRITQV